MSRCGLSAAAARNENGTIIMSAHAKPNPQAGTQVTESTKAQPRTWHGHSSEQVQVGALVLLLCRQALSQLFPPVTCTNCPAIQPLNTSSRSCTKNATDEQPTCRGAGAM